MIFTSGGNLALNNHVKYLMETTGKDVLTVDGSQEDTVGCGTNNISEHYDYFRYPSKGKGKKSRNRGIECKK
jgi:hypothetical protein